MKKISLVFVFALCELIGFAQKENIIRVSNLADSTRDNLLNTKSQSLLQYAIRKYTDSIKIVELTKELSLIKEFEYSKRSSLSDQIKEINTRNQKEASIQKVSIDSFKTFVKGYPVVPFQDTLFYLYNRLGASSIKQRAETIAKRIRALGETYDFNTDKFYFEKGLLATELHYKDELICSALLVDGIWSNQSTDLLAKSYKLIIIKAINDYREINSWSNIFKKIGLFLLVLSGMSLVLYIIIKLFSFLSNWMEHQLGKKINGIKLKNYTLFNAKQEISILKRLINLFRLISIVVIILISLPLIFSILPWTREIAKTLLNFIINPAKQIAFGFWNYLPNLFTIIILIIVNIYIRKGFHFLSIEIEKGVLKIDGFYKEWAKPTYQIISILLFAFLIIVVFPYLPGSDSPVFKGVSVFIGLLFTFGSTGSLSNIISGLVLTYTRAFKIGDRVKIGDNIGDVIEKSLLVTRIRTIKNEIISIPNSSVMNNHTINYNSDVSDGNGLILHTTVTIGYDAAWRTVHQLLINAALATEGIEMDPAPFVLQTSLDDFYVSYQINAYTKLPNLQATIYSNLHIQIQEKFNEAGVEIMSPSYNAIRDGNASTVPISK